MVTRSSIPFAIPGDIGLTSSTITDNIYTDDGTGYDFAIDGIPYISNVGTNTTMERHTVLEARVRQDTQLEPGEHVMTAWWVKAQSSFHLGAGQKYLDSNTDVSGYRFWSSRGLDVWTPGQVRLLKGTTNGGSSAVGATCRMCTSIFGGVNVAFVGDGSAYKVFTESQVTTGTDTAITIATATATSTGVGTVLDVATDGTNFFVADANGVWRGTFASPGTAMVKFYSFVTAPTSARLGWVKQRLVLAATEATNGARVYELDSNAAPASALPAQKFTHPNKGWVFTDITEGPNAIYVSGYAGATSSVHKFVLDTSGVVPTLTTGITALDLPLGELCYGIKGYGGSTLGVVTSQGFRVAAFNGSDLVLGGLTISQTNTTGAVCGSGKFFYTVNISADNVGTIARVDPGSETDKSVFAWAEDLRAGTGTVSQVLPWGNRLAILVPSSGFFVQEVSRWVTTGNMITSRLRFDTLEKKRARLVRMRLDPENGHGTATVGLGVDSQSTFTGMASLQQTVASDTGDVPVYLNDASWYALQFTLSREDVSTEKYSPVLSGFQLKVLPASFVPTRTKVPLLCFDEEETRTGGAVYRPALARLKALESIQSSGRVIRFQVLAPDPTHALSELVIVESVDYMQISAPDDDTAFGGTVTVTVRSIG